MKVRTCIEVTASGVCINITGRNFPYVQLFNIIEYLYTSSMKSKAGLFLLSAISFAASFGIAGFGYMYFVDHRNVLGVHSQYVTPIEKSTVIFPSATLTRYYEPIPGTTMVQTRDWLGYEATQNINDDGINSYINYPIEKADNLFRIITLGDSFTFGAMINTEDNYSSKLSQLLNGGICGEKTHFEVLNLGVMGYDIQYTVEHFARHGQKYHPDLVIWLINPWNLQQMREHLIPLEEQIEKDTSESARQKYIAEKKYYFAASQAMDRLISQYGMSAIVHQQEQFFKRFTALYDGAFLAVMFSDTDNDLKDMIRDYAHSRTNGYFFGDLPETMNQEKYSLLDTHPNSEGHMLIAENIYKFLISQKIVSCQ